MSHTRTTRRNRNAPDYAALEEVGFEDEKEPGPSSKRTRTSRSSRSTASRSAAAPAVPAAPTPAASQAWPMSASPFQQASNETAAAEPSQSVPATEPRAGREQKGTYFTNADITKLNNLINKYKEEESKKQAENAAVNLHQHEMDTLTGHVVRYMLFHHYTKPGVPVPRNKLNEVITADIKEHKQARKIPAVVIATAQARIIAAMGIEMRELEHVSAPKSKKGVAAQDESGSVTKTYVLRSTLPVGLRREFVDRAERDPLRAFQYLVLALIHLEGGSLEEVALWNYLHQLGIRNEEEHPVFGTAKDLLTTMEACRYVSKSKKGTAAASSEEQVHMYEWAEAARDEFDMQDIKAFISNELKAYQDKVNRLRQTEDDVIELD